MSKLKIGALVAAIALALLCCVGGALTVLTSSGAPQASTEPTETVTFAPSRSIDPPNKAPAAAPTIEGDMIGRAGADFPAGTYRVERALAEGEYCYWIKSSDAEGKNVIEIDTPPGGRPQVTIKKGQWFRTSGCPIWRKQ